MPSVAGKSIQDSRKVIKLEGFFSFTHKKTHVILQVGPSHFLRDKKRPSNCTGTQWWNFCFYIFMELEAGLSNVLITSTPQSP